MRRGVRLLRLSVQDVGTIMGRIDLGPFAGGVSVISGRNEVGKSTLVEALRAALFERHEAKHYGIRALQTYGTRNAPEMWVELEVGGERLSVHKRFLERPLAEVRFEDGVTVVQGAEADELLLARLEGRAPGKRGGTRNDMGVWGLLWVTQDETAREDPAQKLDEDVRGALADSVGRQVGRMLGGKHGERVRARVLEYAGQFFTRKTSTRTGELRAAEERRVEVLARVKRIESAVAEVEEQAARHAALSEELHVIERRLPELEEERRAAALAEARVQDLAAEAQRAEQHLALAEAELSAAQKAEADRAVLTKEAAALEHEVEERDRALVQMEKTLADRARAAAEAHSSAVLARNGACEARSALEEAEGRLARARKREEAAKLAEDLRKAEGVFAALTEAARERVHHALEELDFEVLEGLAAEAARRRAMVDAEGTRVVVRAPGGEPTIVSAGGPSTINVPGLGVLEVEPARSGLAQAVATAREKRAALGEALFAVGVGHVQEARERYAARAEAEAEEEELGERLKKLAPKGLEALAEEVAAGFAEQRRLEAALDDAAVADREREGILRELAGNRANEKAIEDLRQREQDVAVLRAARDAVGTHVEIRALVDLRVRASEGGAPGVALAAGGRYPLTLTQATTAVLEDIAEIRLDPRGEDLAKSIAKLTRAERELDASLRSLGVASLQEAKAAASAWACLDGERKRVEERLAAAAPEGMDALHREVDRIRQRAHALEGQLAAARKAAARKAQIEADLAANRVTKEALSRLRKLWSEVSDSEAAVVQRAARVRAISGPVAGGPEVEWAISEATRLEAVGGVVWEVVPGEAGEGLDVEGAERRFADALARAGATDLEAARERWKAGLRLGLEIAELERELGRLAPAGIDALRDRAAMHAIGCGTGVIIEEADDIAALAASAEERRKRARTAGADAERAADEGAAAERLRAAQEASVREARATREGKAERLRAVAEKLEALRVAEPDGGLVERRSAGLAARDEARRHAEQAAAALDAATPDLLRGEVHRAEGALESLKKRRQELRDEEVRQRTLLEKAAAEGRFEELEDARAELDAATDALARLEQEANAALLLANVVEEAYAEAQRIFLAPVLKEAAPYLTKLRPGTELRMTRDLKVDKVLRRGAEEEFEQLSGGTREQLSVIVRLALARVMASDKRPLPLILDDTMGWTDDSRFLSMVQILRDAARELQIILLTCHPSRFERFQADYMVDLDQLKSAGP